MTDHRIPDALKDVAAALNKANNSQPGAVGDGVALTSVANPAWYDLSWREIESMVRHMCQIAADNGPVAAKSQIDALMPKLREMVEEYPR